jgi:hypothetical protein
MAGNSLPPDVAYDNSNSLTQQRLTLDMGRSLTYALVASMHRAKSSERSSQFS